MALGDTLLGPMNPVQIPFPTVTPSANGTVPIPVPVGPSDRSRPMNLPADPQQIAELAARLGMSPLDLAMMMIRNPESVANILAQAGVPPPDATGSATYPKGPGDPLSFGGGAPTEERVPAVPQSQVVPSPSWIRHILGGFGLGLPTETTTVPQAPSGEKPMYPSWLPQGAPSNYLGPPNPRRPEPQPYLGPPNPRRVGGAPGPAAAPPATPFEKFLSALDQISGIEAPPPPEVPNVQTPTAPRPSQTVPTGALDALLAQIMLKRGSAAPSLAATIGR